MGLQTEGNVVPVEDDLLLKYRFSINDFSALQCFKLRSSCLTYEGNWTLKGKLKDLMEGQWRDRNKFIQNVVKDRREILDAEFKEKLYRKLRLPQSFTAKPKTRASNASYMVWQPLEDVSTAATRRCSKDEACAGLPYGGLSISGWERLKWAFFPKYYVPNYSPVEASHNFNYDFFVSLCIGTGVLVGVTMAVSHGLRFVTDFDRTNLSNIYASKYDAYRKRHDAFFRGFARYAYRWGWRVSFLVGGMTFISQALCIYRLKDTMLNYVAASFIPFGLYKWTRGLKGIAVTGTIGIIFFGLPLGFLFGTCGLNPRLIKYDTKIYPVTSSPYYWYNWSDEKRELSERRLEKLLAHLEHRCSEKETKESNIYRDLFATNASG